MHSSCTASIAAEQCVGLQLRQITAAGTEKALLADATEAHPDASYVEQLRLFKVRRSVADAHSQRACSICARCALPAHMCSQLPRLIHILFGSTLFVWLFGCLVVWLFVWLLAWLLGWLVGWLVGCLVAWLLGG